VVGQFRRCSCPQTEQQKNWVGPARTVATSTLVVTNNSHCNVQVSIHTCCLLAWSSFLSISRMCSYTLLYSFRAAVCVRGCVCVRVVWVGVCVGNYVLCVGVCVCVCICVVCAKCVCVRGVSKSVWMLEEGTIGKYCMILYHSQSTCN